MHGGFFKAAAGVMPLVKRGEEPQQNKRTASFEKVAASDMTLAATWRSGRDSNPRTAFDRHTISNRARYDHFDTTAYAREVNALYYNQVFRRCQANSSQIPWIFSSGRPLPFSGGAGRFLFFQKILFNILLTFGGSGGTMRMVTIR
jgi:hypothetical protein